MGGAVRCGDGAGAARRCRLPSAWPGRWRRAAHAVAVAAMAAAADGAAAQELITAQAFFDQVAEVYAGIRDYQADVVIASRRFRRVTDDAGASALREVELSRMAGSLSFKRPDLLRVDFSDPAGQVLVSDGDLLTIYVPRLDLIIEQSLGGAASPAAAGLASRLGRASGLRSLRSNYAIAYEVGPDPVLLEDGSGQEVVRLLLRRRAAEEGFETIEVAVGSDKLIRSIVGEDRTGARLAIEFSAVRINRSIPDARFSYDSPPDANVYRDVLFGDVLSGG